MRTSRPRPFSSSTTACMVLSTESGRQAHRVDAELDQVLRDLEVVRGRLAADAGVAAVALGALDRLLEEGEHAGVALVEVEGHHLAVAVDAERELGEVVGADREAVEALGELVDQDHVVGDLAHHVDLEAALAALEAFGRHHRQHLVGLVQAAAERDHDLEVRRAPWSRAPGASPRIRARRPRGRRRARSATRRGSRSSGSPRAARRRARRGAPRTRWS